MNGELYSSLQITKTKKLSDLIPPSETTSDRHKTVVTIPEDLPLDPKVREVLSKGAKFTPTHVDEEVLNDHVSQFFRRVKLHAYFNNPNSNLIAPPDDSYDEEDDTTVFKPYRADGKRSTWTLRQNPAAVCLMLIDAKRRYIM